MGKHWALKGGFCPRLGQACLPISNYNPSPQTRLSHCMVPGMVLWYIKGVLGKATIQSHITAYRGPEVSWPTHHSTLCIDLYLVHWFSCHTSMAGGTLWASTLTNHLTTWLHRGVAQLVAPKTWLSVTLGPRSVISSEGQPLHDRVMVVECLVAAQHYLGPRRGLMDTPCHVAWPVFETIIPSISIDAWRDGDPEGVAWTRHLKAFI